MINTEKTTSAGFPEPEENKLSTEEMQHVKALHDMIVAMIEEYKRDHGEPPADMLAVYNYIHRKQIEHAAEVTAKQALYK